MFIEARLPRPAGLELSARLLAARPHWDIEVDEDGLSFVLAYVHGALDPELMALEEACRNLERTRSGLELELKVSRITEESAHHPSSRPLPGGFGPWRLIPASDNPEPPPLGRHYLRLARGLRASGRWQAGEALLLAALAEYLSPPPGAPETRGWPTLALESAIPLAPSAAALAGSGPVTLLTDEAAGSLAAELARLNHPDGPRAGPQPISPPTEHDSPLTVGDGALPLWGLEIITGPFKALARKRIGWAGYFGLIAVHLSPYLAARRLKTLAGWLRPEGALIVSGFNPGPQTAHLLRAAARAGLSLAGSVAEGDWAALKLEPTLVRPELPPLTGSLVPELVDLPPAEEFPDLEALDDETDDSPEDEGLMLAEDEDDEE